MPTSQPQKANFVGTLIGVGSTFLKSGECNTWDEECKQNQAIATQARLEEAKAAQAIAANNADKGQQQQMLMIGGGAMVFLVFIMLMLKK